MQSADVPAAMMARQEAHALAFHLYGGDAGILAGPEAAGCKLDAATAAANPGSVPANAEDVFVLHVHMLLSVSSPVGSFGRDAIAAGLRARLPHPH